MAFGIKGGCVKMILGSFKIKPRLIGSFNWPVKVEFYDGAAANSVLERLNKK